MAKSVYFIGITLCVTLCGLAGSAVASVAPSAPVCVIPCASDHGVCVADNTCLCHAGWDPATACATQLTGDDAPPNAENRRAGVLMPAFGPGKGTLLFLNAMYQADEWVSQPATLVDPSVAPSPWDDGRALDLDAVTGLPRSLQSDQAAATVALSGMGGLYPGGSWVLLWEGTGSVTAGFDAAHAGAAVGNRQVLSVTPSDAGIMVRVEDVDEQDPVTNLRLVPAEFEAVADDLVFWPITLTLLQRFGVLRFGELTAPAPDDDESPMLTAADRVTPQRFSQAGPGGLSVEFAAQLANWAGADLWLSVPVHAADDYVQGLLFAVAQSLDANARVLLDYSGQELHSNSGVSAQWARRRAAQVADAASVALPDRPAEFSGEMSTEQWDSLCYQGTRSDEIWAMTGSISDGEGGALLPLDVVHVVTVDVRSTSPSRWADAVLRPECGAAEDVEAVAARGLIVADPSSSSSLDAAMDTELHSLTLETFEAAREFAAGVLNASCCSTVDVSVASWGIYAAGESRSLLGGAASADNPETLLLEDQRMATHLRNIGAGIAGALSDAYAAASRAVPGIFSTVTLSGYLGAAAGEHSDGGDAAALVSHTLANRHSAPALVGADAALDTLAALAGGSVGGFPVCAPSCVEGRGVCTITGQCACYSGFAGDDCSTVTDPAAATAQAAGELEDLSECGAFDSGDPCGAADGRGMCVATHTAPHDGGGEESVQVLVSACACQPGWYGADCAAPFCAGLCGLLGTCADGGECECFDDAYADGHGSCATCGNDCAGHGQCSSDGATCECDHGEGYVSAGATSCDLVCELEPSMAGCSPATCDSCVHGVCRETACSCDADDVAECACTAPVCHCFVGWDGPGCDERVETLKETSPLGVNVAFPGASSAAWGATNLIQRSSGWFAQPSGVYGQWDEPWSDDDRRFDAYASDGGYNGQLPTRALPPDTALTTWVVDGEIAANSFLATYDAFAVTWDGVGVVEVRVGTQLSVEMNAMRVRPVATPDVKGRAGLLLRITRIDESDPIRNIAVVPERVVADESGVDAVEFSLDNADARPVFHPAYVDGLAPYGVLRFRDWMGLSLGDAGQLYEGDDSVSQTERDASSISSTEALQGGAAGASPEYIIRLAAEAGADAWLTVPHNGNSDYLSGLAARVAAAVVALGSDAVPRVWVESGDEAWNLASATGRWAAHHGLADADDTELSQREASAAWHGARSAQVWAAFAAAFETAGLDASTAIVRVLGAHVDDAEWTLWAAEAASAGLAADVLAIDASFCRSPALPARIESSAALSPAELATACLGEVESMPLRFSAAARIADAYGLHLAAYQAGAALSVPANLGVAAPDGALGAFLAAQRAPEMEAVYEEMLEELRDEGLQILVLDRSETDARGVGVLSGTATTDATDPKYLAVVAAAAHLRDAHARNSSNVHQADDAACPSDVFYARPCVCDADLRCGTTEFCSSSVEACPDVPTVIGAAVMAASRPDDADWPVRFDILPTTRPLEFHASVDGGDFPDGFHVEWRLWRHTFPAGAGGVVPVLEDAMALQATTGADGEFLLSPGTLLQNTSYSITARVSTSLPGQGPSLLASTVTTAAFTATPPSYVGVSPASGLSVSPSSVASLSGTAVTFALETSEWTWQPRDEEAWEGSDSAVGAGEECMLRFRFAFRPTTGSGVVGQDIPRGGWVDSDCVSPASFDAVPPVVVGEEAQSFHAVAYVAHLSGDVVRAAPSAAEATVTVSQPEQVPPNDLLTQYEAVIGDISVVDNVQAANYIALALSGATVCAGTDSGTNDACLALRLKMINHVVEAWSVATWRTPAMLPDLVNASATALRLLTAGDKLGLNSALRHEVLTAMAHIVGVDVYGFGARESDLDEEIVLSLQAEPFSPPALNEEAADSLLGVLSDIIALTEQTPSPLESDETAVALAVMRGIGQALLRGAPSGTLYELVHPQVSLVAQRDTVAEVQADELRELHLEGELKKSYLTLPSPLLLHPGVDVDDDGEAADADDLTVVDLHATLASIDLHSQKLQPGKTTSPTMMVSVGVVPGLQDADGEASSSSSGEVDASQQPVVNVGFGDTVDVSMTTILDDGVVATCLYYNTTSDGWDTALIETLPRSEDDGGVVHCRAHVFAEYMVLSEEEARARLFGPDGRVQKAELVDLTLLMMYGAMYLGAMVALAICVFFWCFVCKRSDSVGKQFDDSDYSDDEEAPLSVRSKRQGRGDGSFVQSNPMRGGMVEMANRNRGYQGVDRIDEEDDV